MTIRGYLVGCLLFFWSCFAFILCKTIPPQKVERSCESLKIKVDELISKAQMLQDENGWILTDCDGMKYAALAAVGGLPNVNLRAAELAPGQYQRRPAGGCRTTWSRDMGLGLFYYMWDRKELGMMAEHIAYGALNHWQMGTPFDDGRVMYTPQMIGILHNMQFVLGGPDSLLKSFPGLYVSGLTGYERGLQLIGIALHGEMGEYIHDIKEIPTAIEVDPALAMMDVSKGMFKRIKEAYDDDPKDVLAAALYGIYAGDYSRVFDLCQNEIVPDYDRCEDGRCELTWLMFSCSRVLKRCEN